MDGVAEARGMRPYYQNIFPQTCLFLLSCSGATVGHEDSSSATTSPLGAPKGLLDSSELRSGHWRPPPPPPPSLFLLT